MFCPFLFIYKINAVQYGVGLFHCIYGRVTDGDMNGHFPVYFSFL